MTIVGSLQIPGSLVAVANAMSDRASRAKFAQVDLERIRQIYPNVVAQFV